MLKKMESVRLEQQYCVRPDQLSKLLHGCARSNFWANRRKKLIKLGGRGAFVFYLDSLVLDSHISLS